MCPILRQRIRTAIFEKECGELGLDWKEVTFNRTQYAMDEWDVLGSLKSL
ncbi:MAG: hypothetical protein ACI82A_001850 [Candidatus Azotimanducaceae bacterium]|jgi:hypothetical protein